MKNNDKLTLWQERLAVNDNAFSSETALMDRREALYRGEKTIQAVVNKDRAGKTPHVRNICAEMIEAQISSDIPAPKVTARRKEDEMKAKLIEDMLRNELDRMPFESLNDMMERTVPIQGGAAFLVEWDNSKRTHRTVGELCVSALHPKQLVPQNGVYSGIEDMDYIILKNPATKEYIRRKYGVDVSDESEMEPDVKSTDGSTAEDMVTQYIAYYRNDNGGIGLYSWVGDTELEDLEDYQARRLRKCAQCGAVEPLIAVASADATYRPVESHWMLPDDGRSGTGSAMQWVDGELIPEKRERKANTCPYCGGSRWESGEEDLEELAYPVTRSDGSQIGGQIIRNVESVDELGMPVITQEVENVKIPYYKPGIFPVILQKNVSVYGKFLGDSDIDKIETQQNTTNRIERKIIDKLVKSGSFVTMPTDAKADYDPEDMKPLWLNGPQEMAQISVHNLEGNIQQDLQYLSQIYEEARQIIGVTDSFQGRHDPTATSGKAKEFAAAQSAGRLESKRTMKQAAYAALFEAMFKFKLAYADEPRPVVSEDIHGNVQYQEFNRYDFLEQDEAGEWYWNDQFLFSCDTSAPLASNREAMWQETRMNLQTGAFGNPADLQTLILFWAKMELLHYPGAGETKAFLEERLAQQQEAMMAQQQAAQMQNAPPAAGGEEDVIRAVLQRAQQDALRDSQMGQQGM